MLKMLIRTVTFGLLLVAVSAHGLNRSVGEAHLDATTPTAALRNADHSPTLAVTVWYPIPEGMREEPLLIGPPDAPLFVSGSASPKAIPASGRFPVVLLSHGFGGSARMMAWFGTALARAGFVVVAVDHPGSNGRDPITANGALWWWERSEDLKSVWKAVQADPTFSAHVDATRLGVAGFSAGGFAALVAAGARTDASHFVTFCRSHPGDGVCAPQLEAPDLTTRDIGRLLQDPAMRARFDQGAGDHAVKGVRAVFLMAPALVQAISPGSLRSMRVPVSVLVGTEDTVAPAWSNADVVGRVIPNAREQRLAGVTHYDFLAPCQPAARDVVPQCAAASRQSQAHAVAIDAAVVFLTTRLQ